LPTVDDLKIDRCWIQTYKIKGNISTPYYFSKLIFTNKLVDEIRYYTEDSAELKINNETQNRKKQKQWKKFSSIEIECFIGVVLSMGLIRKSNLKEYRSNSKFLETAGTKVFLSKERFHHNY